MPSPEKLLAEYVSILVNSILIESKQNIINLGFPPVIADILFESFGNKAFLLAKWWKDSVNYLNYDNSTWWRKAASRTKIGGGISVLDLTDLYQAAMSGDPVRYLNARKESDLALDPEYYLYSGSNKRTEEEILASLDLEEIASNLRKEIKKEFLEDSFFSKVFIRDVISGKITDLKPYSSLPIRQAEDKYDKKRVFKEAQPLKVYSNGWKWVNVGSKCQLIGGMMKNCGSTGVMSWDDKATMIVLFDKGNKPHVVATWSPTEKRLSGAEGVGSSAPKEKYEDYIIDIAKTLGAKFDWEKSKSTTLALKGLLDSENIQSVTSLGGYFPNFKLVLKNGEVWYTDKYGFVPADIVEKALPAYNNDLRLAVTRILGADRADFRGSVLTAMDMTQRLGVEYTRFLY